MYRLTRISCLLLVYYNLSLTNYALGAAIENTSDKPYNSTYPLTKPETVGDQIKYKIGIIKDADKYSKSKDHHNTWESYYLQGYLMWDPSAKTASIVWDEGNSRKLNSKFNHDGRGMELSELVTFDGKLLSFDDRSGIVFVIDHDNFYPWLLLSDGDGTHNKGFKAEWATVRNEKLYIGGPGIETISSTGAFKNYNPMWIKVVGRNGELTHLDWTKQYKSIRGTIGIEFPGFLFHEAVNWSDLHKKWFFLPRRASKEAFNPEIAGLYGTNVLITADEHFNDITVTHIGEVIPKRGYSSFKFLPDTNDEVIVALKTVEDGDEVESYITMFTTNGTILMEDTKIPEDAKYEGFEFI